MPKERLFLWFSGRAGRCPTAPKLIHFSKSPTYRAQGFQIVGINLDTLQDDGNSLATVMPNIRHFLLDHNVRWPTLINGQGEKDYAKAYSITEIPANVVVGRNGTVTRIDLVNKNLEASIGQAVRE